MTINVPLLSFGGGEIGPEALARVDLEIYPTTGDVYENVLPLITGALIKAPGTEYIGALPDNTAAIVRPFVFNVDQTRVLQIRDGEIRIVDGDAYTALTGAAATIGTPADNTSTGSSSIADSGGNVTFTADGGEARAYWPIMSGVNGSPTTFRFEIQRRPLKIRIGTTTSAEDILSEITLDPGVHTITFTPTATTYYFRARLDEPGKAKLVSLTRLAAGVLVVPTPWAAADIPELRMEQSNDVVWFYHPDYRTRVLERRGDTSWSLRLFRPSTGPFEVVNQTDVTMTPGALSGSTTLTSSKARFSAGSVGQLYELEHQGQREELNATAVDQASDPIRVIGVDESRIFALRVSGTFSGSVKLQKSAGNDIDWQDVTTYSGAASATVDDELPNQIIYYRFICSAYTSGTIECELTYAGGSTVGRAEIVEYTSPTQVVIEVLEPFGAVTATTLWSEGAWSTDLGWSAAGAIEESRHWLVRDDRVWGSETDDYEGFQIGADAAEAIARRLGTGDVNTARWIESAAEGLLIGTSGGEIRVSSNAFEEPITPLNVKARSFGDEGSANAQAVRAGGRVVFIDRTRMRLMQCYYDDDGGKIDTDDLTRLHERIAGDVEQDSGGGFVEIAYQKRPQPRIWAVRSDGQLAVLLYGPKEGVYAWARITGANGGLFKSVCVVPGAPEDRVHVLVEREINGSTVTYHERFALQRFEVDTDDDGVKTAPKAWRLQCALSSDGAATDSFSGLDHYEGETVRVWGDGRDAGEYVVTGGAITTDREIEYAIIGLDYQGKWRSSKLAYGAQMGTAMTMRKEVGWLGVVTYETPVGAVCYGRTFEDAVDPLEAPEGDGSVMDAPLTLWSQEYAQPFTSANEIDERICLVMNGPAPVTILALIPQVGVAEQQ